MKSSARRQVIIFRFHGYFGGQRNAFGGTKFSGRHFPPERGYDRWRVLNFEGIDK